MIYDFNRGLRCEWTIKVFCCFELENSTHPGCCCCTSIHDESKSAVSSCWEAKLEPQKRHHANNKRTISLPRYRSPPATIIYSKHEKWKSFFSALLEQPVRELCSLALKWTENEERRVGSLSASDDEVCFASFISFIVSLKTWTHRTSLSPHILCRERERERENEMFAGAKRRLNILYMKNQLHYHICVLSEEKKENFPSIHINDPRRRRWRCWRFTSPSHRFGCWGSQAARHASNKRRVTHFWFKRLKNKFVFMKFSLSVLACFFLCSRRIFLV